MTGIVVDRFKDHIYIFADGRLLTENKIFTESYKKIVVDGEGMYAVVGEVDLFELVRPHINYSSVDIDEIKNITGDITVIGVNNCHIREVIICPTDRNHVTTYDFSILPIFFGTGESGLAAAYYALHPGKCTKKSEYLGVMRKIFDSAAKRNNTMNGLTQYESIYVGNS
jgi:hypothetical protein